MQDTGNNIMTYKFSGAPEFEDLTNYQVYKFTMNGKMRVERKYIDQSSSDTQGELVGEHYTDKSVDIFVKKAKMRISGYYGITDDWLFEALDRYPLRDKSVLVVGSTQPWYEIIAFVNDAKSIDVVEYGKRPNQILDSIFYIAPKDLEDVVEQYDVIISISSLEHDGLGRYGDPLNPDGDFEYMEKMKALLTLDGMLLLSIPIGEDAIVWNAHRIYGAYRLKELFRGWEVLDTFGYDSNAKYVNTGIKAEYQPIFVLGKENE